MARFIPRLYLNPDLHSLPQAGENLTLSDNIFHYLKNVLRVKIGHDCLIFDGKKGEWAATITEINKKSITAVIKEQTRAQEKNQSDLWLIFAPVKQIESLIRQTTEIGISKFIPVKTEYSTVNKYKEDRLRTIAIEAAEQSERLTIPPFNDLTPLQTLLENWPKERGLILCDESHQGIPIAKAASAADKNKDYALLIGPEGGFSDKEREMLYTKPFVTAVSLGRNILKADTAAITALSCWKNITENKE
ncbi:MAG: 16S rRNA (uracil(1498)-N(3))-methyltransferase [Alphaproteobacteria bacterium]